MKDCKKIIVSENLGYGVFRTDCGTVLIDFDDDGRGQVVISDNGKYKIIGDDRDENGEVLCFYVK